MISHARFGADFALILALPGNVVAARELHLRS